MNKLLYTCAVFGLVLTAFNAEAQDLDRIARNLVTESRAVQPGEVVVINGGPTEIGLMGAIQVAVRKSGGQPVLILDIPEANARATMETPMEHLSRTQTSDLLIARMADAFVNVSSVQDPDLYAEVPEDRLSATRRAAAPLRDVMARASFRSATLGQTGGIPTEAYAASRGADFATMSQMFWEAVSVEPTALARRAKIVANELTPGGSVTLTTERGTDLRFVLADSTPKINAGLTADVLEPSGAANVWLPAGEAFIAVDEESATGTLVIPNYSFRGLSLGDLRIVFDGGAVTSVTADSNGDKIQAFLDASSVATRHLSVVDVGANPKSVVMDDSDYLSWEMDGMVTLGIGYNLWAGGTNSAEGALAFHVRGATLQLDGRILVERGELRLP